MSLDTHQAYGFVSIWSSSAPYSWTQAHQQHVQYVQHIHWDLVLPDRSKSLQKKRRKKRLVADLLTMTPPLSSIDQAVKGAIVVWRPRPTHLRLFEEEGDGGREGGRALFACRRQQLPTTFFPMFPGCCSPPTYIQTCSTDCP